MTGFPTALTTGRKTQLRQLRHSSEQYLCLTPNTVIWQTQPDAIVDGAIPYAEFDWNGTDAGDRADVKVGMTVLISSTSDYLTTTFFRGRVRLAPDVTTFYINETSANLAVTNYVTVLDDYDLHERLERRLADGTRYADYDIAFTKLPPLISGLQSSYVDTEGGATASISFAPTITAQEAGATISSYLWDVADGTITTGTSASQNITVSFPGASTSEQRWVRFTATDSEGTSQYFVFEVFTINPHSTSSSVVKLAVGDVSISVTRLDGYNATVRAWSGISTVLDRTRCTIVSIDDYDGTKELAFTSGGTTEIEVGDTIGGATSGATAVVVAVDLDSGTWAGGDAVGTLWINEQSGTFQAENLDVGASANLATIADDSVFTPVTQNVSFVGRLQRESSTTSGDDAYGQSQQMNLNIQGFYAQLGLTHAEGLMLATVADSSAWGEISSMTVGRALVYQLAWYTTFLNLCSLTLPSDIGDYDWNEYILPPAPMAQWINDLADDINAYLIFSASGECTIQRHASYAGVSGLTTVIDFVLDSSGASDIAEFTLDLDYIPTSTQAIAGAATYNTTTLEANVYKGRAPAQVYGQGWELSTLDQQIMKSDLSDADAQAEVGSRVASHLAYVNPKAQLSVRLPSGYYWLVPCDHQLYTFTIDATDSVRGRAFTTSDKWLCTSLDYTHDVESGGYNVNATFEVVTTGANYGITVTQIIDVNDLTPPDLPPLGAGFGLSDPLSNYPLDDPDFELPGYGAGIGEPGGQTQPELGCDLLNVSMRTGVQRSTANNTVLSATYVVQVEGYGRISSAGTTAYDFTDLTNITFDLGSIDNSRGNPTPSAQNASGVNSATSPLKGDGSTNGIAVAVTVDLGTPTTVTNVAYQYLHNHSADTKVGLLVIYYDSTVTEISYNQVIKTNAPNTWHTHTLGGVVPDCQYVTVIAFRTSTPTVTGTALIDNITINTSADVEGDAFYYGFQDGGTPQVYAGLLGFRVNSVKPGTIPQYKPTHKYVFPVTGDGFPIVFDYNDSDYTDNANRILTVTVCGEGMALSQL